MARPAILEIEQSVTQGRYRRDRVVDRVKPWFMVHGLVYGAWFMVSLIMSFLRMVDYPLFFPSRSTLTLDTIATLSGT